ncbi:MAG TPA: hypothetical protein VLF91_00280 [Candidatus Saccharimonadales bacterium]|nr:hypothetical protein [Candidatus Saccharimonadales bacterium]
MRRPIGTPLIVASMVLACLACGVWIRLAPTHVAPSEQLGLSRYHFKPRERSYTFPAGGRQLSGAYRFVALYGTPGDPALGALGEQSLTDTVTRIKSIAALYQPLSSAPIYPTFEIISTVASASPTDDNDYSRPIDLSLLRDWVETAQANGIYVVLDLQPGRADFLTQAKQYEALLREPNVGLALDPEWRLAPTQVPLEQIGSVSAVEVNSVSDWLAALVDEHKLPQKLFVLHEFRLNMLPDRSSIDTTRPELSYIIQMDGQGTPSAKQDTWQAITALPPVHTNFGWKNFYTKDTPILDPAATMQITPTPWYISYQ